MSSTTSLRFPIPSTYLSPPPAPCPWLWRCHSCHIWYRLATTRRCLECDHEFCLADTATTNSSAKKRKRSSGPCRAEFDYVGWAARGAWRRTMLLNKNENPRLVRHPTLGNRKPLTNPTATTTTTTNKPAAPNDDEGGMLLANRRWLPQSSLTTAWGDEHRALEHGIEKLTDRFADKKEALYVRRQHNCWLHCDFPSECHHAMYKAQQEGRPVLAMARATDRAYLAKLKQEKEEEEEKQQQQQARSQGPSGRIMVVNKKEDKVSESAREGIRGGGYSNSLSRELLMRFSDDSSDSDSSDSDFDGDMDTDDASLPGSPPTEDEVFLEGQSPSVPISPRLSDQAGHTAAVLAHMSPDLTADYSYSAFKKAAGIDTTPLISTASPAPSTTTTTQTFDVCATDDRVANSISSPIFPIASITTITTTTTTPSAHLTSFTTFEPFETTTTHSEPGPGPTPAILIPASRECSKAHISTDKPDPLGSTTPIRNHLEQAYSAQAWFPSSSSSSSCPNDNIPTTANPPHRRRSDAATSPRAENTARMLILLGRRTSLPSSAILSPHSKTITESSTISVFESWQNDSDSTIIERVAFDVDGDRCMLG